MLRIQLAKENRAKGGGGGHGAAADGGMKRMRSSGVWERPRCEQARWGGAGGQ